MAVFPTVEAFSLKLQFLVDGPLDPNLVSFSLLLSFFNLEL